MQAKIAADHPALPGHFPGHPVVPAVVILNAVLELARARLAPVRICGLKKVKFMRPLGPEESFEIHLGEIGAETVSFSCRRDEQVLVRGRLTLAGASGAASAGGRQA